MRPRSDESAIFSLNVKHSLSFKVANLLLSPACAALQRRLCDICIGCRRLDFVELIWCYFAESDWASLRRTTLEVARWLTNPLRRRCFCSWCAVGQFDSTPDPLKRCRLIALLWWNENREGERAATKLPLSMKLCRAFDVRPVVHLQQALVRGIVIVKRAEWPVTQSRLFWFVTSRSKGLTIKPRYITVLGFLLCSRWSLPTLFSVSNKLKVKSTGRAIRINSSVNFRV